MRSAASPSSLQIPSPVPSIRPMALLLAHHSKVLGWGTLVYSSAVVRPSRSKRLGHLRCGTPCGMIAVGHNRNDDGSKKEDRLGIAGADRTLEIQEGRALAFLGSARL